MKITKNSNRFLAISLFLLSAGTACEKQVEPSKKNTVSKSDSVQVDTVENILHDWDELSITISRSIVTSIPIRLFFNNGAPTDTQIVLGQQIDDGFHPLSLAALSGRMDDSWRSYIKPHFNLNVEREVFIYRNDILMGYGVCVLARASEGMSEEEARDTGCLVNALFSCGKAPALLADSRASALREKLASGCLPDVSPVTGTTHEVRVFRDGDGVRFEPAELKISSGDGVKFVPQSGTFFSITFNFNVIPTSVRKVLTANMRYLNNERYGTEEITLWDDAVNGNNTISFGNIPPGTYDYYCQSCEGVGNLGKIIVE